MMSILKAPKSSGCPRILFIIFLTDTFHTLAPLEKILHRTRRLRLRRIKSWKKTKVYL